MPVIANARTLCLVFAQTPRLRRCLELCLQPKLCCQCDDRSKTSESTQSEDHRPLPRLYALQRERASRDTLPIWTGLQQSRGYLVLERVRPVHVGVEKECREPARSGPALLRRQLTQLHALT